MISCSSFFINSKLPSDTPPITLSETKHHLVDVFSQNSSFSTCPLNIFISSITIVSVKPDLPYANNIKTNVNLINLNLSNLELVSIPESICNIQSSCEINVSGKNILESSLN